MKQYQYRAIHTAIVAVYGKPDKCELCNNTRGSKRFEWSNKDHKYSLLIKDWWSLCAKCHREWDAKKFGKVAWNKGQKGIKEWHNVSGLNNGTPWNKDKKTGLVPKSAFKKGVTPWNKGIKQKDYLKENNLI